MTVTTSQVTTLLENVLFESPALAAQNAVTYTAIANLSSSTASVAGLASYLANQPEAEIASQIVDFYQGALNRAPSAFELNYYVQAAETGLTASQIAQGVSAVSNAEWAIIASNFATSPEFLKDFGLTNGVTPANAAAVVSGFYENILGRNASSSEISYYVNELDNGVSAATLLQNFTESPEYQAKVAAGIAVSLANYGAGVVAGTSTTSTLITSSASGQSSNGATVTLTTGTDQVSGATTVNADLTPYLYNGKGPTLNVGDSVTNVANLIITDQAGQGSNAVDLIPAGTTLANIQNITLDTNGNAGYSGTPFDTTGITGVKAVTVTSQGSNGDVVSASGTTAITVTHGNTSTAGTVTTLGGSTVDVTTSGGTAIIGDATVGTAPLASQVPTGAVTVTQNNTSSGGVSVLGGTNVTVSVTSSSNNGAVIIGNTEANTGATATASAAGAVANPTGTVSVSEAGTGAITVFGGTSVTIADTATNNAGTIIVGDAGDNIASNQPSGAVTITETAGNAYDGASGSRVEASAIEVYGGTNVTVTDNAASYVTIGQGTAAAAVPSGNVSVSNTSLGSYTGIEGGANVTVTTAGGAVSIGESYVESSGPTTFTTYTGTHPSGAVSVINTVDDRFTPDSITYYPETIDIDGGTTVAVTADGDSVLIGTNGGLPSGNVTVSQANTLTGTGFAHGTGIVQVDGGANVTVTTTGGSVSVGSTSVGYATGAVAITDSFSGANGANTDSFQVLGGTTVAVTTTATSGSITVGGTPSVDATGIALKNPGQYASGNVTIADVTVNGKTSTYGTGSVNVYTNGATNVSVTGGSDGVITDADTVLATAGANAGQPIGASHLTSVVLDGNQAGASGTTITSNALANLTITDDTTKAGAYSVVDTSAHSLTLTVGGNKSLSVTDTKAGALTVTDNGTASSGTQTLIATSATSATFTNSAAQSFSLASDSALTSITASNSGALTLGDLSGLGSLASVNATAATGTVTITGLNGAVTSFDGQGSKANETITLDSNAVQKSLIGGSGTNTLIANYAASASDTALGNNAHITGFTTLALGAKASSATTHEAFQSGQAAAAQVETVTVTSVAKDGATTYTVNIGGGAVSYTDTGAGETTADVAAHLAGELFTQGNAGDAISYTAGASSFTVTGPAAGTAFTTTLGGTGAADLSDATTTTGQTKIATDNSYNAGGFTALTVGATTGDVTLSDVGAGASLTITASQGGSKVVNYVLADATGGSDTLPLTVGVDGTSKIITTTVLTTGIENVTVASKGIVSSANLNTVTIGDSAAQAVTITGDENVTLTLNTDANATSSEALSKVTSIDATGASGAVNVNGVFLKTNATHTIKGGSGVLTATSGATVTDIDTVTTGTGGGVITLEASGGGSWVAGSEAYGAGSETINLSASTAAADELIVTDGAVATYNGTVGGVTGFQLGISASTADDLHFAAAKTVLGNVAAGTAVISGTNATNIATVLDGGNTALGTLLANLKYSAVNGVITFSATGGHQLSDFTSGDLVSAAEIIVNTNGTGNQVAAFSYAGNTYVVSNDAAATLEADAATSHANGDSIIDLLGVSSVAGFGTTSAQNTILSDNVTNPFSGVANSGSATAAIYNEGGYASDTIVLADFGTSSTSITNLAASASLTLDNGGSGNTIAAITITQAAAAGNNSLTLDIAGTGDTYKSLTVTGDAYLVLDQTGGGVTTISSLADAANTVTSITVEGSGLDISAISDTALTKIDASAITGAFTLGDGGAISNAALTVSLASGYNSVLTVSGAGDTISQVGTGAGAVTLTASGGGTSITVTSTSTTHVITASGAGDPIALGNSGATGGYTVTAGGANDVITFTATDLGTSTVTIGGNAVVTLGAGNETILVANDQTGAVSSGSYAFTTLKNAADGAAESVSFAGDGNTHLLLGSNLTHSEVNVAQAGTLAAALDIAANIVGLTQQPGNALGTPSTGTVSQGAIGANTGVIDWFQYGGNTYIVDSVNSTSSAAAHTALGTHDYVIELVGLVNIGASGGLSAGVLTL